MAASMPALAASARDKGVGWLSTVTCISRGRVFSNRFSDEFTKITSKGLYDWAEIESKALFRWVRPMLRQIIVTSLFVLDSLFSDIIKSTSPIRS